MTALIPAWRRWLAPAVLAVLLVPSVGMLFARVQSRSAAENRMLAPAPAPPTSLAAWRAFPRAASAYLSDHFAFRRLLIAADNQLHWRLGGQIDGGEVLRGKADRLFLRQNLLIVTGADMRPKAVDTYSALICKLHDQLAARSVPMVFSMAPSSAVIYPEDLPNWVPHGAPSEADLLFAQARACGVKTVDLRPVMMAAKPGGSIYYHHDTHWTQKGALIAYNALVQGLGRPDWKIPPQSLTWRTVPEVTGDLRRMAGATDLPTKTMQAPDLTAQRQSLSESVIDGLKTVMADSNSIASTGHPGPTVLIIGDSYSQDFLPPYFAAHVGKIAWLHHQWCGFDWAVFDRVKPDYVILMPADRFASCAPHARSLDMPS
jgi:hypothetical protein